MDTTHVAAVTPGADAARAALAHQTRAPDEVFSGADGLRRAQASGARWIWIIEGGDPRPDALHQLLHAQTTSGSHPSAMIIAGAVVDDLGRLHEPSLPGFDIGRADIIDLVGRGMLPIRHTTFANCLIDTECLERYGFPDTDRFGPYAAVEWSARVLRERDGYFHPSSVVEAGAAVGRRPPLRSAPALARVLRSGTWSRGERLAAVTRALRAPG